MHDPLTVAHEIYLGPKEKKNGHYRSPLLTIWHRDPETDGTDDSCGWFMRPRHCNQQTLEKIKKEYLFNYKHNYWFDLKGEQLFSTSGTLIMMYETALWIHFNFHKKKLDRYMRKHLHRILHFAENSHDCIGDSITKKWGTKINEQEMESLAGIIYSDICRSLRPWYKHPRWHVRHWHLQFHPWQRLKRRYWDKCSICGKRGFKGQAYSDWDGKRLWHAECDTSSKPAPTPENVTK